MAFSSSLLHCRQPTLLVSSAQISIFVRQHSLPVTGWKKVGFTNSRGPKTGIIRCHNETQVLESVDRAACPSVKAEIDPSAFANVDLRVGLITGAKLVLDPEMTAKRGKPTDSRRYLQLIVDIGCETRTVISECRYVMDVEDAIGKKVLVVANVPPIEILGIESHGLILTGFNYDPTPMPRSFKVILPGLGRLPPGSQVAETTFPK